VFLNTIMVLRINFVAQVCVIIIFYLFFLRINVIFTIFSQYFYNKF